MVICRTIMADNKGVVPNIQHAITALTRPALKRNVATKDPAFKPLVEIEDKVTPRLNSINGTVMLPISSKPFKDHSGSVKPLNRAATANTAEPITNNLALPPCSSLEMVRKPTVLCKKVATAKKTTATDKPTSPKARAESGKPKLPELGKLANCQFSRIGTRQSLSTSQHSPKDTAMDRVEAKLISSNELLSILVV